MDKLKDGKLAKRSKGINIIAATVIVLAVALVVAVAISLWSAGFIKIFTAFEKVEVVGVAYDPSHKGFEALVRNTGSKTAVIEGIRLNGVQLSLSVWDPVDNPSITNIYDPAGATCELVNVNGDKIAKCDPGESIVILVCPHIGGIEVKNGVIYEITVQSGDGKLYPAAVYVP